MAQEVISPVVTNIKLLEEKWKTSVNINRYKLQKLYPVCILVKKMTQFPRN